MPLVPYLCLHSLVYWMNHSIGYSVSLKKYEDKVLFIHRLQDLIVDSGMHLILFIHSMFALFFAFDGSRLLINTGKDSQLIHSQYALELVYYTFDIMKMCITPSSKMKKDYLYHHVISILLLLGSYWSNYIHIGLITTCLLNSTNLVYDGFTFHYLTRDLVRQWLWNSAFWLSFAHLRIYIMFLAIMKPIYSNLFNPYYSLGKKLFFIPTMTGLYGLQFIWFYKLTHVLIHNTRLLVSRPDILVYIPNSLLYLIDRHLITLKQYALESNMEPPPMPEGLEEFMKQLSDWEKKLKEHLIEKESESETESESESVIKHDTETETDSKSEISDNGSEIQGRISDCSEKRRGLDISHIKKDTNEIEPDYEFIENIHEEIPTDTNVPTMKQLLTDIFTKSIYASDADKDLKKDN